jgi:hypothetical protein
MPQGYGEGAIAPPAQNMMPQMQGQPMPQQAYPMGNDQSGAQMPSQPEQPVKQ